ncbi:hypothetical protein EN879_32800 [Mesorhizobium sp. M7A.F.Ca.AU.002.02.1.1]|nr:hypothetical protein EN879_32800 [Mesorhizobium sp. M7A.F.Ca.AU.002.02.1.1]
MGWRKRPCSHDAFSSSNLGRQRVFRWFLLKWRELFPPAVIFVAMTKLSDLGPRIPRNGGNCIREKDRFYACPSCGQKVDQTDLRQVMWHERPGHEPLEPEDSATIIKFPDPRK